MKAVRIIGIVYIAGFIWFFIVFCLFVYSVKPTSGPLEFGITLYNFYYYGGIPLALLFCVVVFSFIGKKATLVFSRYFLWVCMLFAFNYSAQVFPNMFNLSMMNFMHAWTWLSEFIPSMILVAVLVALLSQWGKENKKIVHAIAWVGLLFSAFMAAYVIYYIVSASDFSNIASRYSGGFQIAHALIIPVGIAWFFSMTRDNEFILKG